MTTLTTQAAAGPALDPGKARSLQRVTSPDGFFLICALDHLSQYPYDGAAIFHHDIRNNDPIACLARVATNEHGLLNDGQGSLAIHAKFT